MMQQVAHLQFYSFCEIHEQKSLSVIFFNWYFGWEAFKFEDDGYINIKFKLLICIA